MVINFRVKRSLSTFFKQSSSCSEFPRRILSSTAELTHTHTHTHTYIYIYMYFDNGNVTLGLHIRLKGNRNVILHI